jgi:hypothetical protein
MDPRNQRQHLPPPYINPFMMMQLLLESQAYTMPWYEGFNGMSLCAAPVYQGMAQQHQYRAPNSGPSRNQRSKGSRKAEAQHSYNFSHESSETIAGDRSTGIYPSHARIGASDNTGASKVWRTPSRNPSMADHNSTQQTRTKPYNRDRSNRTRRRRTDKVDPSVYEIPIVKSKSMLISLSILYRPFSSTILCRRRDGRWSKNPNAGTIHAVNMDVCTCAIDTCIVRIDVDSIRRDY